MSQKKLQTVYRMEDSSGDGPYRIRHMNNLSRLFAKHNNSDDHPAAMEDFDRYPNPNEFFGFKRKKDLNSWFRGFQKDLKSAGFVVVKYKIPKQFVDEGKSKRQIKFVKTEAIKL